MGGGHAHDGVAIGQQWQQRGGSSFVSQTAQVVDGQHADRALLVAEQIDQRLDGRRTDGDQDGTQRLPTGHGRVQLLEQPDDRPHRPRVGSFGQHFGGQTPQGDIFRVVVQGGQQQIGGAFIVRRRQFLQGSLAQVELAALKIASQLPPFQVLKHGNLPSSRTGQRPGRRSGMRQRVNAIHRGGASKIIMLVTAVA